MNVGAEPKKIKWLVGLLVVAAGSFYYNSSSSEPSPSSSSPSTPRAATPASPQGGGAVSPVDRLRPGVRQQTKQGGLRSGSAEFRPSLKPARPEDRPDPMTIDPTLRLDLLAKVQGVKLSGGNRSLFDFSAAPPPPAAVLAAQKKAEEEKAKMARVYGPLPPPVPTPTPAPPPPPPIPLKFYGFVNPAKAVTDKRAFFLEGEEIFVASEGELIKKRYKVVRIGVNSAVVEDTEHKHQQTLPLEEQAS